MPISLDTNTGVLIKKAARLFERVANKDLDKFGVTHAQTIFLIRLWENDGQNQMQLTKSAGLKQPTVVRILDRMERDKLVDRVRNNDDRRMFNFYLTPKAKKICQDLEKHADSMQKITKGNLSDIKVHQLNKLLLEIINNLDSSI